MGTLTSIGLIRWNLNRLLASVNVDNHKTFTKTKHSQAGAVLRIHPNVRGKVVGDQ